MRNAIAILIALIVLVSVGFACAHVTVNAEKDQVVLTETTLYGDKAAADGLTLVTSNDLNNRLVWDTTHVTGEAAETSTRFTFSSAPNYFYNAPAYSGIRIESHFDTGLEIDTPIELLAPIARVYRELFDATEPGHESNTTIRIADYYDCYPIIMDIDLPHYTLYHYESDTIPDSAPVAQIVAHYREFFRIPVLEDEYLEIHVRKGPSNSIGAGSGSVEYGDRFNLYSYSLTTDDAMYFLFDAHTYQGALVDTSLIPGGYGIYRQPYGYDDVEEKNTVDPTELSMIFSLDPSIHPQAFEYNEVYHQLHLLVHEQNQAVLYIIDAQTHQLLQKLVIAELGADEIIRTFFFEDTYIVLTLSGNRLAVIDANAAGEHTLRFVTAFTGDSLALETLRVVIEDTAWNGERLAVVTSDIDYSRYPGDYLRFRLAVFDASGMRYCGDYASSLTTGYESGYRYHIQPRDTDPLTVEWKE